MSDPMIWGDRLSDDQAEALRDTEATTAGGDFEFRLGAAYLYDLPDGLVTDDFEFDPGKYLRTVTGNQVLAFVVTGDAEAYVRQIEDAYQAEVGDGTPPLGCPDCGAGPREECLVPGCQGGWA